jgi:Zn finger protein HypA/HybF involved in hydrogenase expression
MRKTNLTLRIINEYIFYNQFSSIPSSLSCVDDMEARMNCWQCKTELIWGGDHTGEDYNAEDYEIVSNLSCPKCESFVLVYHQKKESADVEG